MKSCPVEGCDVPTANDKHMCRTHWFKVPLHLRTAVWGAYNRYLAATHHAKRTAQSISAAGVKLRHAQQEATDAVNDQLKKKVSA